MSALRGAHELRVFLSLCPLGGVRALSAIHVLATPRFVYLQATHPTAYQPSPHLCPCAMTHLRPCFLNCIPDSLQSPSARDLSISLNGSPIHVVPLSQCWGHLSHLFLSHSALTVRIWTVLLSKGSHTLTPLSPCTVTVSHLTCSDHCRLLPPLSPAVGIQHARCCSPLTI